MPGQAEWVAVDWGTSNVRAWAVGGGRPLDDARSDRGMGRLQPDDYPAVLGELISALDVALPRPCSVVVCGMAGARQGWMEAPYLELPADIGLLGARAVRPANGGDGLDVHILSGVCRRGDAEDVMRGEETQILGLMRLKPGFEGLVCMPGTHSKWVEVENGRIARFATAMTGELYQALRDHSVLRHSLDDKPTGPHLEEGIAAGMAAGLADPDKLTSLLFRTRAASLLSDKPPDWCAGYLSGLLVGAEVAGYRAARGGEPVILIGSDRLSRLYGSALNRDGAQSQAVDATEATLAGLAAARDQIEA